MGEDAAMLAGLAPELTPEELTLSAARLLLKQEVWGRSTMPHHTLGWLSLVGSLRLAAGGSYSEDGVPSGPDEPMAAQVLARTCDLLASHLGWVAKAGMTGVQRLEHMSLVSNLNSVDLQRLLATVHGNRANQR